MQLEEAPCRRALLWATATSVAAVLKRLPGLLQTAVLPCCSGRPLSGAQARSLCSVPLLGGAGLRGTAP